MREAILNAVAHKDYSGQTPIQISVYENKWFLWNEGQLPDNWTVEQLLQNILPNRIILRLRMFFQSTR